MTYPTMARLLACFASFATVLAASILLGANRDPIGGHSLAWSTIGALTFSPVSQLIDNADHLSNHVASDSGARTVELVPDMEGKDWRELFNGENLEGWVQKNGTATFRVEDAVIVGETAEGSPNSFLCTEEV
ncbi:MAG: DUF1080 domain-containing protein, partial [Planctomycetes bacterium]|nr:DUF1080 domain-containing protein [Planctomycetota bacterium]